MKAPRLVKLGGEFYKLGTFTIADVVQLVPQIVAAGGGVTMPQMQARASLVFAGIKAGGYGGDFADFNALTGVTHPELDAAQVEIGRAIGFYREDDAQGEAAGTEPASP